MPPAPARRPESAPRLPRRMAPTDALFWYAQQALPIFRPIIAGLYLLDRPPDPARVERGYDALLARVPRLRQRVREAPLHLGLPEWVDDPHLDRAYHLRHLSLPAPGTRRALLDLCASLLATPLDPERPLWEAWWIDGLEGGRAAWFLKLHHSVVDGVGSLAILDAMTTRERDAELPLPAAPPRRRARSRDATAARLAALALDAAEQGARLGLRAARLPLQLLADPRGGAEQLARTARGLRGVWQDLTTPPVRDPLAGSSSGLSRRLDVMELPLERLRKIKAPLGVTLNDVVLAALAGALGAYHRERRVHVATLHCMVPMNLRGRDERDLLGNRVGLFNVTLPVGERDPRLRLARITAQTASAKRDKRGAAAPFLVETLTLLPGWAFRWLARRSLGRVNVACTNVPGVAERRYLAGARIDALYPFASVVEGTPLVIALLSYADRFDVGIDTDPEAIPDPHRIAELFEAALAELEALPSQPEPSPAGKDRRAARRHRDAARRHPRMETGIAPDR